MPTYTLDFTFTDPAQGIASYTAQVGLSSTGAVVSEVNLPHMGTYTTPLVRTSLSDATQRAVKLGFDPARIDVELWYDTGADAVIWHLSQVFFDNGVRIKYHSVDINIHNGQIIKHADGYGMH